MSTVTLSKPHCAITSAENPEGIVSQEFTTTLPDAHISLTLFAIAFPLGYDLLFGQPTDRREAPPEKRLRGEAIQSMLVALNGFVGSP
jgi:hypothetical protein